MPQAPDEPRACPTCGRILPPGHPLLDTTRAPEYPTPETPKEWERYRYYRQARREYPEPGMPAVPGLGIKGYSGVYGALKEEWLKKHPEEAFLMPATPNAPGGEWFDFGKPARAPEGSPYVPPAQEPPEEPQIAPLSSRTLRRRRKR